MRLAFTMLAGYDLAFLAFSAASLSFHHYPVSKSSPFTRGGPSSSSLRMTSGSRVEFVRRCSAATFATFICTRQSSPSAATTTSTVVSGGALKRVGLRAPGLCWGCYTRRFDGLFKFCLEPNREPGLFRRKNKVNSVLSAYGIPMISDEGGFTSSYVKFDEGGLGTICACAFPSSWVETNKDGLLAASNYQTGDSLVLNVNPDKANAVQDMSAAAIAAETTPSGGIVKVLQEKTVVKGGVNYAYLTVKYNVTTRSGYDVERISYIAATVRQRKLYSLVATVSSERRNRMDIAMEAIRASFRVGDAVDLNART